MGIPINRKEKIGSTVEEIWSDTILQAHHQYGVGSRQAL
jgi:hypothetical protein